jgi:hypothetical protein
MESQRYAFELLTTPTDALESATPSTQGGALPAPTAALGTGSGDVSTHDLILFFHRLIQEKALPETCIDVTDYSHVPGGPGVMLLCHEAHYSLSRPLVAGRPRGQIALRCATKRGAEGDTEARIRRVLRKTLRAAELVETHPSLGGRLTLDTTRAVLSIEDRLLAPNDEATFAALTPILAAVVTRVWGAAPVLSRLGSAKECFQVEIAVPIGPPVTDLLARV